MFNTHRITLNRFCFHVQVPDFDTEVVTADHVSPRIAQLNVAYTRYYFREEASVCWIFGFFEYFTMVVAESCGSHVAQSYRSLTTAVDEKVTLDRVKLGGCYYFREFLHIRWLNVYYVCILRIGKL